MFCIVGTGFAIMHPSINAFALMTLGLPACYLLVDGLKRKRGFHSKSKDAMKEVSIRGTSFEPLALEGGSAKVEQAPSGEYKMDLVQFVEQELSKSDRPELTSAKVVVSGGREMKSGDYFKLLYHLADKLNAAVGAS